MGRHACSMKGDCGKVTDTLFADVSEYQVPVNNSYPTRCCRFAFATAPIRITTSRQLRVDAGRTGQRADDIRDRLHLRPPELVGQRQHRALNDRRRRRPAPAGGLMLDVESGGNPPGDGSSWINPLYWNLADYAGSAARIIGYANTTTSTTCGGCARPACVSSRPDTDRIRTCRAGRPPVHRRQRLQPQSAAGRSTIRPLRHELGRRTDTATIRRRVRHPDERRMADGAHRRRAEPNCWPRCARSGTNCAAPTAPVGRNSGRTARARTSRRSTRSPRSKERGRSSSR